VKNLLYIGISIPNQRTNPLAHKLSFCTADELSKLKISQDDISNFLEFLSDIPCIEELTLVSTCNRFELIIFLKDKFITDDPLLREDLAKQIEKRINHYTEREISFAFLFNEEAQLQILRTYCGLNSGLVGESEISIQFNGAFKQALNLGFLKEQGSMLLEKAQSLRDFFNKHIYLKPVSYCDIAIQKAYMGLSLMAPLKTVTILGSGSTAIQSCLSLVNNLSFSAQNLTLIHRVSSASVQIQNFKESPNLSFMNFIRSKKNGYKTEKVEKACLNSDLVIFGIDAKSPVISFPDNSKAVILDFNSNPSCTVNSRLKGSSYIGLETLDKYVREYSYRQNNDFDLLNRLSIGEDFIISQIDSPKTLFLNVQVQG
jgi:glutamyl-tRNA reductase